METQKFTFKTNKGEGKYRSFQAPYHEIKLKGVVVGSIVDEIWRVRLMKVKSDINEDGNPNCNFMWVTMSYKSDSLDAAKKFLQDYCEPLIEKYRLNELK